MVGESYYGVKKDALAGGDENEMEDNEDKEGEEDDVGSNNGDMDDDSTGGRSGIPDRSGDVGNDRHDRGHQEEETLTQTFEVTSYTAYCDTGCTGVTATDIDVGNTIYHNGKRIVAVDPSVIPLGSTVMLHLEDGETIEAVAEDTGGDIQGNRIDLLVSSEEEALSFGKQSLEAEIIE